MDCNSPPARRLGLFGRYPGRLGTLKDIVDARFVYFCFVLVLAKCWRILADFWGCCVNKERQNFANKTLYFTSYIINTPCTNNKTRTGTQRKTKFSTQLSKNQLAPPPRLLNDRRLLSSLRFDVGTIIHYVSHALLPDKSELSRLLPACLVLVRLSK